MKKLNIFYLSSIAASLTMTIPLTTQGDDTIKQMTKPQSTIQFGVGYLSDDNARFGQFSGLRDEGAYGIFNIDFLRRNDDSGTWFKLFGRNLGLQNREIRLEHSKQGNWGYSIEFNQTPRYEPFTAITAVEGIGSSQLEVPTTPTMGNPTQLKTERESISVGINKILPGNFELNLHFRNEEKDGARIFGRGNRLGEPSPTAVGGFEFTPEPINFTTRQFGATLDYAGKDLQVTGGYHGSIFLNKNSALHINGGSNVGGIYAPNNFSPIALPPDNQAHQAFLSGGYSFTPTTRGTLKASYTHATQTDSFFPTQFSTPGIGSNLGGQVDTALVQSSLSARPIPKLSLLANARFEDRDDKTPVFLYNPMALELDFNGNRWTGLNQPRSFRTWNSKFEASYALPMNFRVIGGIDYEHWDRTGSPATTGHRSRTDEISYRAELRRTLAETVTGTISYIHSDRFGSHFLTNRTATDDPFFNLIAPINLADRKRDKVRLSINWEPIEPLSVQVMIDESWDNYGHRAGSDLGVQKGSARNYSIDAVYTFSEAWQATGWFSRNETFLDQASLTPAPPRLLQERWTVGLENISSAFGAGLNGKPTEKIDVGANLEYSDITDKSNQSVITNAQTYPDLNMNFQLARFRLFAKYAIQRNYGIRLDYILDHFKTNEWTWNSSIPAQSWPYTDGTHLTQDRNQLINFVGFSAYYSWQ